MGVLLDMDKLDLEALRGRVATLSAEGHGTWITLPLGSAANRSDALTQAFAQPRGVCVVVLEAEAASDDGTPGPIQDPREVLAQLQDMSEQDLGGPVDLVLMASPVNLTDLPDGYHRLTLDDFDAPAAMLAILGGAPAEKDHHQGPTVDARDLVAGQRSKARAAPEERRTAWRIEPVDDSKPWLQPGALAGVLAVLACLAGVGYFLFDNVNSGASSLPVPTAQDATDAERRAPAATDRPGTDPRVPGGLTPDTSYARQALRLHEAPDATSQRVAFASAGDAVTRLGDADPTGWSRVVLSDGTEGFVFTPLLSPLPVSTGPDEGLMQVQDGPNTPPMVLIGALYGRIGSTADDPGHRASEAPARLIRLSTPRLAGAHEVTRKEWRACVDAGVCHALPPQPRPELSDAPASGMTWTAAQTYVAWLSRSTGRRYRLPSEAEWELAASAGARTPFSFGDRISMVQASFAADQPSDLSYTGRGADAPERVGRHTRNSLGLTDMHGNVAEWTADCWQPSHENRAEDGSPLALPDCAVRAVRGGSWRSPARDIRSAARFGQPATEGSVTIGFRVFREL